MIDLLKKLTSVFAVADDYEEIRDVIIKEIEETVDEYWCDNLGNLIAVKHGIHHRSGKKIMLTANMNTSGVMATHILNNGLIKIAPIGINNVVNLYGQKVAFKNGVPGVIIGNEKNIENKHFFQNLFVDIGSGSKDETESLIKVFSMAMFLNNPIIIGNKILSKYLDNMIGCSVLIKLIKEIESIENDTYFVFTSQDVSNIRSMITAAYQIRPDIIIRINTVAADVIEEVDRRKVEINHGPVIKVFDKEMFCHPIIREHLEESAGIENLSCQYDISKIEINYYNGVHTMFDGILTGNLSIPCKHKGSPFEMICIDDAVIAIKILRNFINRLDKISYKI
ncbi:Putative aminopeptidase ysdC [Clostridioides difficile]|nr:Putative aminopeptidase ysdC [Clostridioides difficile]